MSTGEKAVRSPGKRLATLGVNAKPQLTETLICFGLALETKAVF